jgi:hypothetical protein
VHLSSANSKESISFFSKPSQIRRILNFRAAGTSIQKGLPGEKIEDTTHGDGVTGLKDRTGKTAFPG